MQPDIVFGDVINPGPMEIPDLQYLPGISNEVRSLPQSTLTITQPFPPTSPLRSASAALKSQRVPQDVSNYVAALSHGLKRMREGFPLLLRLIHEISRVQVPLTSKLGGTSVSIGGLPAPLYYVSLTQINAHAPARLTPGNQYQVVINSGGARTAPGSISVIPTEPGIAVDHPLIQPTLTLNGVPWDLPDELSYPCRHSERRPDAERDPVRHAQQPGDPSGA